MDSVTRCRLITVTYRRERERVGEIERDRVREPPGKGWGKGGREKGCMNCNKIPIDNSSTSPITSQTHCHSNVA